MNNITTQKKLEYLINYIQGINIHYLPHSEDCNRRHPMSISSDCTCYWNIWLDLQKQFEEIDNE